MMRALAGVAAVIGVALGGVANDRYGARRVQAVTLPLMAFAFAGLSIVALVFSRFHKCETPTLALRGRCAQTARMRGIRANSGYRQSRDWRARDSQSRPYAKSRRQVCRW
jgi:nitrate/nitrite transporter NarK